METNIHILFNKLESNSNEESSFAKQSLIELFNQSEYQIQNLKKKLQ